MLDRLSCLVKMIVGSLPVKNPHLEKRQERHVIDFHLVHEPKPLSTMDHVHPKPIVKEEVREDVIPPAMVCSLHILPFFDNPIEGILGNLELPSVFLQAEMKREITS